MSAKVHKQQHIVVTGGGGFLGSHLCQRLLAMGHKVTSIDSLRTGQERHLVALGAHKDFVAIRRDIIEPLDDVPFDAVDAVFNLACAASPVHYAIDPVHTFKTSVIGILNLMTLCQNYRATLVQASTSEVYGDPLVHPQPESYWGHVNPIGPRACYDEGKRGAETLLFDAHRTMGLNIRVARIFNTYGPNMHPNDGRVVSNLVVQALAGAPMTLYGDGRQTRSFCYVDDLIDGLILLWQAPDSTLGPINLGNPDEFEVGALAKCIKDMTQSPSPIEFLPLPQDDPQQRRPDITRAQNALGWRPKTKLHMGLVPTIAYFKDVCAHNGDDTPFVGRHPANVLAQRPPHVSRHTASTPLAPT